MKDKKMYPKYFWKKNQKRLAIIFIIFVLYLAYYMMNNSPQNNFADKIEQVNQESSNVIIESFFFHYKNTDSQLKIQSALPLNISPNKKLIKMSNYLWSNYKYNYVFIFLHGASFTSQIWIDKNILQDLSRENYASFAIDIPGYGNSDKIYDENWLYYVIQNILDEINIDKFILVIPSMSGIYGLPLIFNKHAIGYNKELIGVVTIAPVKTGRWSVHEWEKVDIPLCIMYGENDTGLGIQSLNNMKHVPDKLIIQVPHGSHAFYTKNNRAFILGIFEFLDKKIN